MTIPCRLVLALLVCATVGCRRRPPEEQFRYRLGDLAKTDPATVIGREVARFDVRVPAPRAVALDGADQLYVAGSNRLDIMTLEGEVQRSRALPGSATCLFVDAHGVIFAGFRSHIAVLRPGKEEPELWAAYSSRSYLTSVAASSASVFVADMGNRVVLCYDLEGNLLRKIGARDPERGIPGFVIPSPYFDLAVEREDSLWVVDPGRHLLCNYHPDGTLRTTWGKSSMRVEGFCGCCNPSHFALLPDGGFVTSEKGLVRVKRYAADGSFMGVIAGPEQFAEGTEGLDLAVDSRGRVVVLTPGQGSIRIYSL